MAVPEIEQLRGNFCLAAGKGAVEDMQPYLRVAANDPCREGVLAMAFSMALLKQEEPAVRCLVPVLAAEGMSDEKQEWLAKAQNAGSFFSDVLKKMKNDTARNAA